MKKLISEIPRVFKTALILAFILLPCTIIGSGCVENWRFSAECAVVGVICVAILCGYVVWTTYVTMCEKSHMESDDKEIASEAGVKAAQRLMLGSVVKTLLLAVVLIVCVAVFKINVLAAGIGASVMILPMLIAPLFVKSDPVDDEPDDSEVEKQC